MKPYFLPLVALLGVSLFAGCATNPAPQGALSQARVSMVLKKGLTTQDQVLAKYGAPNLITMDSNGREVWSYQQHATVENSGSASLSGQGNKFGHSGSSFLDYASVSLGLSGSHYVESSRTATLIIKFNRHNVVEEFSSVYASF